MIIYTDGSCLGNPGPGGWAIYCLDSKKQLSGGVTQSTNNRMELTAVLRALETEGVSVIVTDSAYCKNGVEKWSSAWVKNGWKTASGQPVKNDDLWKQILKLSTGVEFRWVKAHSTNKYNSLVDKLARDEALKIKNNKTIG